MSQEPDLVQALSSLPHGPEFRFVDELLELQPGERARARWTLKGTEAFLKGHFPGAPLLPGVIMVEALAQLGGVIAQTRPGVPALRDLRLTAVRQFKILGSIVPGQSMLIEAQLQGAMGGMIQISGSIQAEEGPQIAAGGVILSGEE